MQHLEQLVLIHSTTFSTNGVKEFYFEGRRRVDLIRFNKFGGNANYNWAWKGGERNGRNFAATRNVFAIPNSDLTVNYNLKQNPGIKLYELRRVSPQL